MRVHRFAGRFFIRRLFENGRDCAFSPIMESVASHAAAGRPVIGICNGFQILCEAGILPGALIRNQSLRFICKPVHLSVENSRTIFTRFEKKTLAIPIAHGEGNYFIHADGLKRLKENVQIVFRYCDKNGKAAADANPNGSLENIAGIINERGNVLGMMPHPERCSELALGGEDGLNIFKSIIQDGAR